MISLAVETSVVSCLHFLLISLFFTLIPTAIITSAVKTWRDQGQTRRIEDHQSAQTNLVCSLPRHRFFVPISKLLPRHLLYSSSSILDDDGDARICHKWYWWNQQPRGQSEHLCVQNITLFVIDSLASITRAIMIFMTKITTMKE